MSIVLRHAFVAMFSAAILVGLATASADEFPSKPIRLVVPAPPGGGTDTLSRLVATALTETAKWTVVTDNIPGAGGNIGFDATFRAPKDGHTLAMGEPSNMIVNPFMYKRIPFDVERDMQPVTLVARIPLVLIVAATSPHASARDLIEAARKKPLSYASSGNGTLAHVQGELWKTKTGVDILHVPYKGAAPALMDVIGGQVDFCFTSIPVAMPMIQAGRVRALAIASRERLPILKDVPTMEEAGFPGMEASAIFGIIAASGIPAAALARLSTEINRILVKPSVEERLVAMGAERVPGSFGGDPASFQKLLREERAKWGPVVKASGAVVD